MKTNLTFAWKMSYEVRENARSCQFEEKFRRRRGKSTESDVSFCTANFKATEGGSGDDENKV